ncbi:unnamed protein product [Closterium sp. Yama58-4]|nr:unnamed protein product [Closterium sp. Yama58-4]
MHRRVRLKTRAAGGAAGASDNSNDEESAGGAAGSLAATGRMAGLGAAEALAEESLKVFFCSRTHSQLSQFISELRRTPFADQLFTVALASRKNLCINQSVLKLGNASAISERCLELQRLAAERKSKASKQGDRLWLFRLVPLSMLLLAALLSSSPCSCFNSTNRQRVSTCPSCTPASLETCPYYAARAAARAADVVVLPYQSLLHKGAREALLGPGEKAPTASNRAGTVGTAGLVGSAGAVALSSSSSGGSGVLSNSVVVVDEAHNLTDALAGMHSCTLSARQVHLVQAQLAGYLGRFRHKLGPGNRRYVLQLQVVARGIAAVIAGAKQPRMQGIDEFLFSLAVDNINLFKLHHYVQASNIAHKVSKPHHYVHPHQVIESGQFKTLPNSSSTFRFHPVSLPFLPVSSENPSPIPTPTSHVPTDQLLCTRHGTLQPLNTMLKLLFLVLPPLSCPLSYPLCRSFPQLLTSARAIILAGGTLQPLDTMLDQLFPSLPSARLRLFSCGHIVPGESVLPLAIAKGPSGKSLEFTFQSRSDPAMITELGRLLVNVCSVAPGGIVVFFPSFAYLQEVLSAWQAGTAGEVLSMMEARKGGVFIEPRGAAEVEAVLGQYRRCIQGKGIEGRGLQGKGGDQGRDVQGKGSQGSGQGGVGTSGGDLQAANRVSPRGAVLLCVMGGKMSEGINFSDDMGRAVVVVGQPFPSPSDPELNERMRFIDRLAGNSSRSIGTTAPESVAGRQGGCTARPAELSDGQAAGAVAAVLRSCGSKGRQLYEDICAKAVNQSIALFLLPFPLPHTFLVSVSTVLALLFHLSCFQQSQTPR